MKRNPYKSIGPANIHTSLSYGVGQILEVIHDKRNVLVVKTSPNEGRGTKLCEVKLGRQEEGHPKVLAILRAFAECFVATEQGKPIPSHYFQRQQVFQLATAFGHEKLLLNWMMSARRVGYPIERFQRFLADEIFGSKYKVKLTRVFISFFDPERQGSLLQSRGDYLSTFVLREDIKGGYPFGKTISPCELTDASLQCLLMFIQAGVDAKRLIEIPFVPNQEQLVMKACSDYARGNLQASVPMAVGQKQSMRL